VMSTGCLVPAADTERKLCHRHGKQIQFIDSYRSGAGPLPNPNSQGGCHASNRSIGCPHFSVLHHRRGEPNSASTHR
jgi:hypothetical protein